MIGSGGRLDGGGQADVGLVDDAADAGIHLLVAPLVERGELGEALLEGALDVGLERGVRGSGPLDRGGERAELLLELRPSGTVSDHVGAEALDLGRHLVAEVVQLALDGSDHGGLDVYFSAHRWPPLVIPAVGVGCR